MMTDSDKAPPARDSGQDSAAGVARDRPNRFSRLGVMAIALVPLALLVVASVLRPAADGLGTHQQLGLPPCSMRVLLGVRCPACGMTTSWSHFMRGDWVASLQSNIGGFGLALTTIFFSPIAITSAIRGRWPSAKFQRSLVVTLLAIAAVTGVEWTVRMLG